METKGLLLLLTCSLSMAVFLQPVQAQQIGAPAPKPLFRDPVHDGAADPAIIWNRVERKWFLFYTNRRANLKDLPGVAWVHGTRIGIAESQDGANWKYRGIARIDYGNEEFTHWAPDVLEAGGVYHMFLSIVPGIFKDWNAPREIVHLTSEDLLNWKFRGRLDLGSDKVIDATILPLAGGGWRMWYKNERSKTPLWYADSNDLETWRVRGVAITDRSGEGPKAFRWHGRCWLVVDIWRGLGVYFSEDCENWRRQDQDLLAEPGDQPTDRARGSHPDVVVSGDRAYLYYFVHQQGADAPPDDPVYHRRTVLQVTELEFRDGRLVCDRNRTAYVHLVPPAEGEMNRD